MGKKKRIIVLLMNILMLQGMIVMASMVPETETESGTETEIEFETETEIEFETETEIKAETKTEIESEIGTEIESETETEIESESAPELPEQAEEEEILLHESAQDENYSIHIFGNISNENVPIAIQDYEITEVYDLGFVNIYQKYTFDTEDRDYFAFTREFDSSLFSKDYNNTFTASYTIRVSHPNDAEIFKNENGTTIGYCAGGTVYDSTCYVFDLEISKKSDGHVVSKLLNGTNKLDENVPVGTVSGADGTFYLSGQNGYAFQHTYKATGGYSCKGTVTLDGQSDTVEEGDFSFILEEEKYDETTGEYVYTGRSLEADNGSDGQIIFGELNYSTDGEFGAGNYQYTVMQITNKNGIIPDTSLNFVHVLVDDDYNGGLIMIPWDIEPSVTFRNETLHVRLRNIDSETKEELGGAVIALYRSEDVDNDGTILEGSEPLCEWNTDDSDEYDLGPVLRTLSTFLLVEKETPEGYFPTENVTFNVNEDGIVTVIGADYNDNLILLKNNRIPDTEETEETEQEETEQEETEQEETEQEETEQEETEQEETEQEETEPQDTESGEPEVKQQETKNQNQTTMQSITGKAIVKSTEEAVSTGDETPMVKLFILFAISGAVLMVSSRYLAASKK